MFVDRKGDILINEIARASTTPDNTRSEAAAQSQWRKHIRAITGMRSGTRRSCNRPLMVNISRFAGTQGAVRLDGCRRRAQNPADFRPPLRKERSRDQAEARARGRGPTFPIPGPGALIHRAEPRAGMIVQQAEKKCACRWRSRRKRFRPSKIEKVFATLERSE